MTFVILLTQNQPLTILTNLSQNIKQNFCIFAYLVKFFQNSLKNQQILYFFTFYRMQINRFFLSLPILTHFFAPNPPVCCYHREDLCLIFLSLFSIYTIHSLCFPSFFLCIKILRRGFHNFSGNFFRNIFFAFFHSFSFPGFLRCIRCFFCVR